jgi:hypothetical protein
MSSRNDRPPRDRKPDVSALNSLLESLEFQVLHRPSPDQEPEPSDLQPLEYWVLRWGNRFQAAYGRGLTEGHPPGVVVWATPWTESLDDPPVEFDFLPRDEARLRADRLNACVRLLEEPAGAGMFYHVASRADGWLKGTVITMMQAPEPRDELRLMPGATRPTEAGGKN